MKLFCILLCAAYLAASSSFAQGPHELLLLVNSNSPDSVEIANVWAELRDVPRQNILLLDLPARYDKGEAAISPKEYAELIWTPAQEAIKSRGIDHVLAWVYSSGFPVLVRSNPTVSILGLTLLRNRLPDEGEVKNAKYLSPLFAGRDSTDGKVHFPQSLYTQNSWLLDGMPLPCMMLGYRGKRGNSKDEILACLRKGAMSDGAANGGTVYFVESDDVRTDARKWQFPLVQGELEALGVTSVITNVFPSQRTNVIGVMAGTASLDASSGNTYLPGAMTEHLTSAGAVFDSPAQTKITEWIRAGATGSSGTIAEPYAIWAKFPDARFYVYYASGCTMLESFYQSVRCPLQLLMIGDPLAQPWSEAAEVSLKGIARGKETESIELSMEVKSSSLDFYGKAVFLVDGRVVARGRSISLAAGDYSGGDHVLRVIAYRTGMVRNQVFKKYKFRVNGSKLKFLK